MRRDFVHGWGYQLAYLPITLISVVALPGIGIELTENLPPIVRILAILLGLSIALTFLKKLFQAGIVLYDDKIVVRGFLMTTTLSWDDVNAVIIVPPMVLPYFRPGGIGFDLKMSGKTVGAYGATGGVKHLHNMARRIAAVAPANHPISKQQF